eukprot:gene10370-biopygen6280
MLPGRRREERGWGACAGVRGARRWPAECSAEGVFQKGVETAYGSPAESPFHKNMAYGPHAENYRGV